VTQTIAFRYMTISELKELHQTVIQQKLRSTKKTVLQTAPYVEDTIPTKSVATYLQA